MSDAAALSRTALVELFEQIDACPREGAGAWVFEHGTSQLGVLFVDNGLICWSTLPSRRRRFIEILQSVSGSPLEQLDEAVRDCVANKVPIGIGLRRAELMTDDQLYTALRLDTVESLMHIAATPDRRGIWRPYRGQNYGTGFRFSLTELLIDATTTLVEAPRSELLNKGETLFGTDADFVYVEGGGLPVAVSKSLATRGVGECLTLARHACATAAAGASNVAVNAVPGSSAVQVVWRDAPWIGVLQTSGPPHAALRALMMQKP